MRGSYPSSQPTGSSFPTQSANVAGLVNLRKWQNIHGYIIALGYAKCKYQVLTHDYIIIEKNAINKRRTELGIWMLSLRRVIKIVKYLLVMDGQWCMHVTRSSHGGKSVGNIFILTHLRITSQQKKRFQKCIVDWRLIFQHYSSHSISYCDTTSYDVFRWDKKAYWM